MNKKNDCDSKKGMFGSRNIPKPDFLAEESDLRIKLKKSLKKTSTSGNSYRFEEYRQKIRDSIEIGTDSAIKEANNSFRVLNHFLIIIATTIFSFSLLFLNNEEFVKNIEFIKLEIVFWVWVLLGFSILAGAIQFLIEYNFFKKWYNTNNNILNKLNDSTINNSDETMLYNMVIEEQRDMHIESNHFCIYFQIFLICLSLILLIISIYQIIFN